MPIQNVRIEQDKLLLATKGIQDRIADRFPEAGLLNQAKRLCDVVEVSASVASRLARPSIFFRLMAVLLIAAIVLGATYGIMLLRPKLGEITVAELLQATDSGFQVIIVLVLVTVGLFTLERKRKRRGWVAQLSGLRALAHIVDLHQLDKDPDRLVRKASEQAEHSPKLEAINTAFLLTRYLDYCGEMLAVIGKVAAFYGQYTDDTEVQGLVDDIEALTARHRQSINMKLATLAPMMMQESSGRRLVPSLVPEQK